MLSDRLSELNPHDQRSTAKEGLYIHNMKSPFDDIILPVASVDDQHIVVYCARMHFHLNVPLYVKRFLRCNVVYRNIRVEVDDFRIFLFHHSTNE